MKTRIRQLANDQFIVEGRAYFRWYALRINRSLVTRVAIDEYGRDHVPTLQLLAPGNNNYSLCWHDSYEAAAQTLIEVRGLLGESK